METRAYLKGTRLSPQKAGLVANAVRGKSVQDAMDFLIFNQLLLMLRIMKKLISIYWL
jgi:large subunit ribosomal protein L22